MESANNERKDLFSRGVVAYLDPGNIFGKKLEAKEKGEYKKDIIIKFGVDPTRPDIHLGHAVVLRKLRVLQDLGCKVVFLMGDFTARIGDPTGKSKVRPEVSQKEADENMATYLEQAKKILRTDPEVFSWVRNADWYTDITDLIVPEPVTITDQRTGNQMEFPANTFLAKVAAYESTRMQKHINEGKIYNVTMQTFLNTLRGVTHSQLIERDMFQERIKNGEELFMHEMVYPILQGVDSHVITKIYGSCDLEVGGTDQTFNMLMGRTIQKNNQQEEQAVMSMELLVGTEGKEKMSKSLDNYIGINEPATSIYGKVMSIPDEAMRAYFTLCAYTSLSDIEDLMTKLEKGSVHPRDVKMRLAKEITAIYHGEDAARQAEEQFTNTFQKGEAPKEMDEVSVAKGKALIDVFMEAQVAESKSELRRLAESGSIKYQKGDEWETAEDILSPAEETRVWKIGKKKFLRIVVE